MANDALTGVRRMHAMNAASSQDDVLPKMSAFFKPGQLVPCVVKALEQREKGNKKNVVLSLRPSLLNQNLAIGNITPGMVCPPSRCYNTTECVTPCAD